MKRALEIEDIPERVVRGRFEEDENRRFRFVDSDNNPVPAEILFTTWRNMIIKIFLDTREKPRFLSLLERSGNISRNFVIRNNLWRAAFETDFPNLYQNAVDPAVGGSMKDFYQNALNFISENPHNERTYWKRYYEMVMQVISRYDFINALPTFKQFILYSEFQQKYPTGEPLRLTTAVLNKQWLNPMDPGNRNANGDIATHMRGYSINMSLREPGVYYVFWRVRAGWGQPQIEDTNPISAVKVNLNEDYVRRVPFQEIEQDIGQYVDHRRGALNDGVIWISRDYLFFDRFVFEPRTVFSRYRILPVDREGDRSLLVSCKICGEVDKNILKKCTHCNNVYCGRSCQIKDHK